MVIWTYLVVEQQSSGWSLTGDSSLSFAAGDGLAAVLTGAGERGWELAVAPERGVCRRGVHLQAAR